MKQASNNSTNEKPNSAEMQSSIEHKTIVANGIRFHLAMSGPEDGPAILCLHGFPEGWASWRPIMERLPEARIIAPDLRGYPGSEVTAEGYDVFTLAEDVKAIIEALGLNKPLVIGHDWGGELGWIFAHLYGELASRYVAVNATHLKTLFRAVITFDEFQPLRIPWAFAFLPPIIPELIIANPVGRKLLKWSFLVREGRPGAMDAALVEELVARFQKPSDIRGPIEYYRAVFWSHLKPSQQRRLKAAYAQPIKIPVTMIWGMKDRALTSTIALKSEQDAGCSIDWRPIDEAGHFVSLEAPDQLALEIRRLLPGKVVPHKAVA